MTKQEEYELEFMRMNQLKKEALRVEQAKKALQRQVSNKLFTNFYHRKKNVYSQVSLTDLRALPSWVK